MNTNVIVDQNSHLMGAIGIAILSSKNKSDKEFDLNINNIKFETKGFECMGCTNNCEIVKIYKNDKLIDAFGNKCNKTIKL